MPTGNPVKKNLNYRYTKLTGLALAGVLSLWTVTVAALTPIAPAVPDAVGFDWYEVLVDDSRALTLAALLADGSGFERATPEAVNIGFSDAQVWARFAVRYARDNNPQRVLVLPKPLLDEVELFSVFPDGRVTRSLAGDTVPASDRALAYRAYAFELEPAAGGEVHYYLRVQSPLSAINLPLTLREAGDFERFAQLEDFYLGGFFGVMVALGLASVLVFVTFRQPIFLYYFFYIGAFTATLACFSGYGMQFIWPDWIGLQQYLPSIAAAATMVAGVLFIRRFLDLAQRTPVLDKLMQLTAAVGVIGAGFFVATSSQVGVMVIIGGALALCTFAFLAFSRCVLAGDDIARYFLVGWLACVVGITAAALDMYGLIPMSTLSAYGIYFGAFAEFAALSVALGARLQRFQLGKEQEIARASEELSELNQNLEHIVQHRTRELQQRNRELSELAIRDSLTGLYNHSTTIELLDQILHQSQRYDFAVTVLMADIDHFKQVNDSYGHQVGDSVLEIVSQTLLDCVRESDIVGRYGGEEFLIVMPHADALAAREFGERLMADVREIEVPRSAGSRLSVSLGIAVYNPRGQRVTAADLIQRADEALYRSKRAGRDRQTIDALSVVDADAAVAQEQGAPAKA